MTDNVKSNRKAGWHNLLHPMISVPAVILVVLVASPFLYRNYRLSVISDPGIPFDVDAIIVKHKLPSEENANLYLQQAIGLLNGTPPKQELEYAYRLGEEILNEEALQIAIEYVKNNEPALQAWEATSHFPIFVGELSPAFNDTKLMQTRKHVQLFAKMVGIRAWDAWENGDDVEAAKWLLCNLRISRHIEHNGGLTQRHIGFGLYYMTSDLIAKWLSKQELTLAELSNFQQEIISIHKMTPPYSDQIKIHFVKDVFINDAFLRTRSTPTTTARTWVLYFQGEPDLKNRVDRHILLNNLRNADKPYFQRPRHYISSFGLKNLFDEPTGPSQSSSNLSPAQIEKAAQSSSLYKEASYAIQPILDLVDLELMLIRLLETTINLEIYRKANNEFPEKLDKLFDAPSQLPVDNFESTGAPLKYFKEDDQHYRLWSVGPDGIDSGGNDLTFLAAR